MYGHAITHVAIYIGQGMVVEAVPSAGVRALSLKRFMQSYHNAFMEGYIGHWRKKSNTQRDRLIQLIQKKIGMPYDITYKGETGYYCSSLIYRALEESIGQPWEKTPYSMTFKTKQGQWHPFFIELYGSVEKIPEGMKGSHPAHLMAEQEIEIKALASRKKKR